MYSKLLSGLTDDFSVMTLDGVGILRREDVEAIANAIGAETVGLLTHSSFDYSSLQSSRVARAALLDPNALPELDGFWSLRPRRIVADVPTLIVMSEHAYEGESPFIIDHFSANIEGPCVSEEKRHDVGHCDILDDTWADFGDRLGIKGYRATTESSTKPFSEWTFTSPRRASSDRRKVRSDYRGAMTERLKTFFSPSSPIVTVET